MSVTQCELVLVVMALTAVLTVLNAKALTGEANAAEEPSKRMDHFYPSNFDSQVPNMVDWSSVYSGKRSPSKRQMGAMSEGLGVPDSYLHGNMQNWALFDRRQRAFGGGGYNQFGNWRDDNLQNWRLSFNKRMAALSQLGRLDEEN